MNAAQASAAVDHAFPEELPPGETLVWQGSPKMANVARAVLHTHWVAGYFVVLLVWRLATVLSTTPRPLAVLMALLPLCLLAGLATGFLMLLAWLIARTSIYSITSRRIVLKIGVALPVSFNIPFRAIEAVALKERADGCGDICLRLNGDGRIGYAALWPHARPFKLSHPEPALRSIPGAAAVAKQLAEAIQRTEPATAPAAERAPGRTSATTTAAHADLISSATPEAAW